MFKKLRYCWNAQMFVSYMDKLQAALKNNNQKAIKKCAEKAIKHGEKAVRLCDALGENSGILRKAIDNTKELYKKLTKEPEPEDPVRKAVKRQFVNLGSQFAVASGRQEDFIADRMVDMYRIAADRLDKGPEVLKMIYVDNQDAPEPLREVIAQYLDKKLTQEQAKEKLLELKSKTEEYVKDLGAKPEEAEHPGMVFHNVRGLEQRLKADIVADSMGDDGSIHKQKLFMNMSEVVMMDKWAGVYQAIGDRDPTADELINAQADAFRATYEANPEGYHFKDKDEFEKWLDKVTSGLKEEGNVFLKAGLPLYRKIVETVKKKE